MDREDSSILHSVLPSSKTRRCCI